MKMTIACPKSVFREREREREREMKMTTACPKSVFINLKLEIIVT